MALSCKERVIGGKGSNIKFYIQQKYFKRRANRGIFRKQKLQESCNSRPTLKKNVQRNLIYRFKANPIKIPARFFIETDVLILKCTSEM